MRFNNTKFFYFEKKKNLMLMDMFIYRVYKAFATNERVYKIH